jgi:hypothetical protein
MLLLLPAALAAERLLTDHVAVDVAADGSFGTPELGLRVDPDGPDGDFPVGGDILKAGRTFDLWAIGSAEDAWIQNAAWLGSDLMLTGLGTSDDGAITLASGAFSDARLTGTLTVVAPWGEPLLFTVLEVTALEPLPAATLLRAFDPDLDAWSTGAYETHNRADGAAAVAWSEADGRAWALSAAGATAGVCGWCTSADALVAQSDAAFADAQLGAAVTVGDLAAGDTARVVFVYAFGPTADEALAAAEDAVAFEDLDRDGISADEDCDDLDAWRSPAAVESPNGIDDDCDGVVDEGPDDTDDTGTYTRDDWDTPIPSADADDDETETAGGCAAVPDAGAAGAAGLLAMSAAVLAGARRRRAAEGGSR